MYCPNCKQEFDGKFCPECGTKLIDEVSQQNISRISLPKGTGICAFWMKNTKLKKNAKQFKGVFHMDIKIPNLILPGEETVDEAKSAVNAAAQQVVSSAAEAASQAEQAVGSVTETINSAVASVAAAVWLGIEATTFPEAFMSEAATGSSGMTETATLSEPSGTVKYRRHVSQNKLSGTSAIKPCPGYGELTETALPRVLISNRRRFRSVALNVTVCSADVMLNTPRSAPIMSRI